MAAVSKAHFKSRVTGQSRVLIEQSIGRGLRLPYGKRTAVTAVDRLNIVAHDKFQEIVDEANKADSPIHLKAVVLDIDELQQKTVTVVSQSLLATKLGITPAQATSSTTLAGGTTAPTFAKPEDQRVAQITYEVIKSFESQPELAPSISSLSTTAIQEAMVKAVTEQYRPTQMEIEGVVEQPNIAAVVAETTQLVQKQTIDIPRILVVPTGVVKSGFHPFTLKLDALRYPVPSEELWSQHLRTGEREVLSIGTRGIAEKRLENYVVSGLVDFNDISYDDHADLLYDLASQTVKHLQTYLADVDTGKVLRCYQREIARFIHVQMQDHFWEEASGYETKITKGFTELRPSAYTVAANDSVLDYRSPPADKSNMSKYLFGGFKHCLYSVEKFQSDSERRLAVILEREQVKWFKPRKGQFQLFYKRGADHLEYQPDFVAEAANCIYMFEPKAVGDLEDTEVKLKRDVAVKWCGLATEYSAGNRGKPWKYALIPHDVITDNMTVKGLADRFG